MMQTTRRFFLKNGALAVAGTAALPGFLTRAALAATEPLRREQRLVVVFQRGAVDGLNMVIPYQERNYYALRPSIAVPREKVLDLNGRFGLHPAMGSLTPLYKQGHLAVVHAVGSPDGTRSHFDAQDYMESGTPGVKATRDGWLNRALLAEDMRRSQAHTAFRAVALGADVPRTLAGAAPALAIANVQDFAVGGRGEKPSPASAAFETMYDQSTDSLLHGTGGEAFEAIRMLRATNPGQYRPAAGANYPESVFAKSMKQVAQLLKADLGVEVAFTDLSGWDTHENQGAVEGQLANRLRDMSDSLAAFWRDLGDEAENVTVVTMSEFGRTAAQNGTGGTDHGHANAMLVLGGGVRGGHVYGKWPGLEPEQLNEGRDLVVTTDYRRVLGELIEKQMGRVNLEAVFPHARLTQGEFLGLV